jgi:FtsP/CotA-like multicopper oxidase with cupredoxin domain
MLPRPGTTLAVGLLALSSALPHATMHRTPAVERILPNDNRIPAGRLRNGVLTLNLELRTGMFRPHGDDGPGVEVLAFGERGRPLSVPGPLVRVPEGTIVAATIRNRLADSTLVLHGFTTRPGPTDDTIQVRPGATRAVRFTVGRAGTYYYWGTTTGKAMEDDRWIDSQLSGGFIVDSVGTTPRPAERVFLMGLWLKPADEKAGEPEREFMVINGKSWPETERLEYAVGDTVRWRWLNPTSSSHPMHLHGFYYEVESRGSWRADTVYSAADHRLVATELMQPGGTMTAQWTPTRPGYWLFHCHFAFHMSGEQYLSDQPSDSSHHRDHMAHRMAGLVLGLHVSPAAGITATTASTTSSPAVAEPARLRLLVQPVRDPPDSAHLMGYVLQTGDREPAPDSTVIPGPPLVLERGRPARITVVNRLVEATAVHWHGIELESYADGVPGYSGVERIFQPIAPGDSFTAAFTPPRGGTFIYHSHANELTEISGGLYGALIVMEPGTTFDTATNRLVIIGGMLRHDSAFGVVNGRLEPAPIELRAGRTYRFRLINIGDARTWLALRRGPRDSSVVGWRKVAKDGADLPTSQAVVTTTPLATGPGETVDFEYRPDAAGDLVLDLDSPFADWRLKVPVRVRE